MLLRDGIAAQSSAVGIGARAGLTAAPLLVLVGALARYRHRVERGCVEALRGAAGDASPRSEDSRDAAADAKQGADDLIAASPPISRLALKLRAAGASCRLLGLWFKGLDSAASVATWRTSRRPADDGAGPGSGETAGNNTTTGIVTLATLAAGVVDGVTLYATWATVKEMRDTAELVLAIDAYKLRMHGDWLSPKESRERRRRLIAGSEPQLRPALLIIPACAIGGFAASFGLRGLTRAATGLTAVGTLLTAASTLPQLHAFTAVGKAAAKARRTRSKSNAASYAGLLYSFGAIVALNRILDVADAADAVARFGGLLVRDGLRGVGGAWQAAAVSREGAAKAVAVVIECFALAEYFVL